MTTPRKGSPAPANDDHEIVQTPSRITPLHVLDRETSKVAGAPRAWRKMPMLEAAYTQSRLGDKDSHDARKRYNAGTLYTELWDLSQKAGRDSTASFDGRGGMGSGGPLGEAQAAAIQRLVATEMHLGQNDRTIVRAVCAFGYSPIEAMAQACLCKDTRVSARLCEAMDALADALDRTEKRGRK